MIRTVPAHTELTSAGGVVHRLGETGPEFALISVGPDLRWQLPKGLVDPGETLEETALREVREETGLTCAIVSPLEAIDYWFTASYDGPPTRFHKHVHFFLMAHLSGDISGHDDEVAEVRWFGEDEARAALAFESERRVLEGAISATGGLSR